ncbi:MAG TPA: TIGR04211 family SH3 domain-containing protein [Gammaproteobacteria bacterium]|nr:TIGR04211 family SH3 domain-containing protein [Gammaproteobacteria bacterium]
MLNKPLHLLLIALLAWLPVTLMAETVYINDRFMVGIHSEKSVDSVITKLVPSGTSLDIIKKDKPLSQVRDPEGEIGWVDNQYLVTTEPGRAQLAQAETRINELEAALQEATEGRQGSTATDNTPEQDSLQKENEELKQLLKSERLRVGELQAQTAELKNRLSGTVNPVARENLEELEDENARLREQLATLQSSSSDVSEEIPALPRFSLSGLLGEYDWKKMLMTIAVSLLVGFGIGIYLLDLVNRRRHGGFRI